jgi:hypothetical protein
MINPEKVRAWMIRWMYAIVLVHLAVGILLPWIVGLPIFDNYHRSIEAAFWGHHAPAAARAEQLWWISLFGPTIQGVALWMGALTRIGERLRSAFAWGWLIVGVALWAPQDMLLSLRADAWPHVWLDCLTLLVMLPPLIWLWRHDRARSGSNP